MIRAEQITREAVTPARKDDGSGRVAVIEPEELTAGIVVLVAAPPPLKVGSFPQPARRARLPRPLQQQRHAIQILSTANLPLTQSHLGIVRAAGRGLPAAHGQLRCQPERRQVAGQAGQRQHLGPAGDAS